MWTHDMLKDNKNWLLNGFSILSIKRKYYCLTALLPKSNNARWKFLENCKVYKTICRLKGRKRWMKMMLSVNLESVVLNSGCMRITWRTSENTDAWVPNRPTESKSLWGLVAWCFYIFKKLNDWKVDRLRTTKMTEHKQRSLSEKPVRGWWLLLSDTPN